MLFFDVELEQNLITMTFDGKNEKFDLLKELFHTMIKMQLEISEQMKINHFQSRLRKERFRRSETSVQPIDKLLKFY